MLYAVKEAKEYNADYVKEDGNGNTYMCFLNPGIVDRDSETPILQQPCWKIMRVTETKVGNITTTITQYPNGHSSSYSYIAANCESYTYEYQR